MSNLVFGMYDNLLDLANVLVRQIYSSIIWIINFISNMIFVSYDFTCYNNDLVLNNIMKHVEENLSGYQTVSYNVKNDPSTSLERIPDMLFPLSTGTYFFWYDRTLLWIRVRIVIIEEALKADIELRGFRWDHNKIKGFLAYIRENANKTSTPRIFSNRRHESWYLEGFMPRRELESVIIPKPIINMITDDLDNFMKPDTLEFYESRGLIYKRGVLLYGKPGCGKSSLVRGIAQRYNFDIYDINLNIDDHAFTSLMGSLPGKVILLFEDIDVAFPKRDPSKAEKSPNRGTREMTMKCFLNAIDGVKCRNNGVIMIFTTNHVENLDPALLRAGRIDLKIELGALKKDELIKMFLVFFPNAEEYAEKIAKALEKEEVIPAEFHGLLVKNMYGSPDEVVAKIESESWSTLISGNS